MNVSGTMKARFMAERVSEISELARKMADGEDESFPPDHPLHDQIVFLKSTMAVCAIVTDRMAGAMESGDPDPQLRFWEAFDREWPRDTQDHHGRHEDSSGLGSGAGREPAGEPAALPTPVPVSNGRRTRKG